MDKIYQEHAKTVYAFLMLRCHNGDLAEELTQETFYQAMKSIDRFDGKAAMNTWLCAIAKNVYRKYIEKHILKNIKKMSLLKIRSYLLKL